MDDPLKALGEFWLGASHILAVVVAAGVIILAALFIIVACGTAYDHIDDRRGYNSEGRENRIWPRVSAAFTGIILAGLIVINLLINTIMWLASIPFGWGQ